MNFSTGAFHENAADGVPRLSECVLSAYRQIECGIGIVPDSEFGWYRELKDPSRSESRGGLFRVSYEPRISVSGRTDWIHPNPARRIRIYAATAATERAQHARCAWLIKAAGIEAAATAATERAQHARCAWLMEAAAERI